MTERALPVALAGHGRWGRLIARDLPGAGGEVAAILVGSEESAAALRASRAAPLVTTDLDELLECSAAAVAVATPAPSHEALARAALDAGKHVFVEKPLCFTAQAARELEAQARESGLVLMTGHVFLYHPAIIELRRLVDEGALGNVESMTATWLNTEPHPGDISAAWCLGPHPLSIIAWAGGAGGRLAEASGGTDRMEIGLSAPDGWEAEVLVGWDGAERERSLAITGTVATARFDGEAGELAIQASGGPWRPVTFDRSPALALELAAFVEAVRDGTAPPQEAVSATVTGWLEEAALRAGGVGQDPSRPE